MRRRLLRVGGAWDPVRDRPKKEEEEEEEGSFHLGTLQSCCSELLDWVSIPFPPQSRVRFIYLLIPYLSLLNFNNCRVGAVRASQTTCNISCAKDMLSTLYTLQSNLSCLCALI